MLWGLGIIHFFHKVNRNTDTIMNGFLKYESVSLVDTVVYVIQCTVLGVSQTVNKQT